MICSTLSGMMAIKHPTLGVLVREDGMVFARIKRHNKYAWTQGYLNAMGYLVVGINHNKYSVHRLVAESFLQNPENKKTVDHINRVKTDNRIKNLRWATSKEQIQNSGVVQRIYKYGVRPGDDKKLYDKIRSNSYYMEHRDELLANHKTYYLEHKDERREYDKKRYEKKKQAKLAAKESQ